LRRWAAIEAENSMHIPSNRRAVDTILVAAPPPVVLAYGIGVDSTALLIELEARGEAPDLVLSADPGAEKPETYEYQRMIAAWMHARGIPYEIVRYVPRRFKHWPPYYSILANVLTNATLPSISLGRHSCSLGPVPHPVRLAPDGDRVRPTAALTQRAGGGRPDRYRGGTTTLWKMSPGECIENYRQASISFRPNRIYSVGRTNSVSSVAEISPPITTVASGFWTSAPAPSPSAIGKNPNEATSAVMTTGRRRASAPSRAASSR